MPRPRRLTVLAAVPCVAAVGLTGCATTIEEGDLESKISRNLQTQVKGQKITVDCPEGKEAKKGNAFSCKARIGGKDATVDVRLQDDDGRFSFRVRSGAAQEAPGGSVSRP